MRVKTIYTTQPELQEVLDGVLEDLQSVLSPQIGVQRKILSVQCSLSECSCPAVPRVLVTICYE